MKEIFMFTDGGCKGNPGPGGYGVVLIYGNYRKELSGGYSLTTNNRMELTACIAGLKVLKEPCKVTIYSDSKYVVDSISKGWAKKWKKNGWKRNPKEKAENSDLWEILLDLCSQHEVYFEWVKAHAGNTENERCDTLAVNAASQPNLPEDKIYSAHIYK